jgi:hypothetical protein
VSVEFAEGQPQPIRVCEVNVSKRRCLQATNKRSSLPTKAVFFPFFSFSLIFFFGFFVFSFLLKDNPVNVFIYFFFIYILLNVTQLDKRWW